VANLIINDKPVEADLGEGLLTVARRNRAHIGFVCDGNGLCTTCECRVLAGAESLTEPNRIERTWIPDFRLEKGYRLACQTTLIGPGEVKILTRAEYMRRLWNKMLNPPAGRNAADYFGTLWEEVIEINIEHIGRFPFNLLSTINRLGLARTIAPVRDNDAYFRDIGRVIDQQSGDMFTDATLKRTSDIIPPATPTVPPATPTTAI
jgi:ferredoxin